MQRYRNALEEIRKSDWFSTQARIAADALQEPA
jgi:hypothetical protein